MSVTCIHFALKGCVFALNCDTLFQHAFLRNSVAGAFPAESELATDKERQRLPPQFLEYLGVILRLGPRISGFILYTYCHAV